MLLDNWHYVEDMPLYLMLLDENREGFHRILATPTPFVLNNKKYI